jgi:hypothetical protein
MSKLPYVYVPPSQRPRPDDDLAKVTLSLNWKFITLQCDDEAALGRIFMWLLGQMPAAAVLSSTKRKPRRKTGPYQRRAP